MLSGLLVLFALRVLLYLGTVYGVNFLKGTVTAHHSVQNLTANALAKASVCLALLRHELVKSTTCIIRKIGLRPLLTLLASGRGRVNAAYPSGLC